MSGLMPPANARDGFPVDTRGISGYKGWRTDGVALASGNADAMWHRSKGDNLDKGIESLFAKYYETGNTAPFVGWPENKLSDIVNDNGGSVTIVKVHTPCIVIYIDPSTNLSLEQAPAHSAKGRRHFVQKARQTNIHYAKRRSRFDAPKQIWEA